MSFIKRSDGTTIYSGRHCVSRGSIGSLSSVPEQDPADMDDWEKAVLATASGFDNFDSEIVDYDDDEIEANNSIISRLWGIYKREEPKFSEYFRPVGR